MEWILITILGFLSTSVLNGKCEDFEKYNYCDPSLGLCEEPLDHTMCKYPNPGPSARCNLKLYNALTQAEKDEIVDFHNKMRSKIAIGAERSAAHGDYLPSASNMRQMYWDEELETIAKRWADQCLNATSSKPFDKCRNTKRFRVGQNIDTRGIQSQNIDKVAVRVFVWYSEVKNFDPRHIESHVPNEDPHKRTAHFTIMIWANTYAIGCARVIFHETVRGDYQGEDIWTFERLVCNYGPAGNVLGQSVYREGVPCTHCPSNTYCSTSYEGLCAIMVLPNSTDVNVRALENSEEDLESTKESENNNDNDIDNGDSGNGNDSSNDNNNNENYTSSQTKTTTEKGEEAQDEESGAIYVIRPGRYYNANYQLAKEETGNAMKLDVFDQELNQWMSLKVPGGNRPTTFVKRQVYQNGDICYCAKQINLQVSNRPQVLIYWISCIIVYLIN